MNYFRQIYYEMKHQKMMTWVSVSGTALAIFLVMSFVMSNHVYEAEAAPESNRSRILYGQGVHIMRGENHDSSTNGVNYNFAKTIYEGLDGVETMAYINSTYDDVVDMGVKGEETFSALKLKADAGIWKIYDYTFIDGRPFNEGEAGSQTKVAVISRSVARKLFGEEMVVGREIEIKSYPYTIVGVVEDMNPILPKSYADVILPYNPAMDSIENDYFGQTTVLLLAKDGADIAGIKKQVEQRYERAGADAKKEGMELVYHEQPYTSKEMGIGGFGSNNSPDTKGHDIKNWIIYSLLILLPAINLSSMTRSRLRHRVAEIGVRRAFGAKKNSIIRQIFGENLLITLIGGAIGLVFSFIFLVLFSHLIFNFSGMLDPSSLEVVNARPDLGMLFRWNNFLWALLFCFILNTLSATVPAWRASKTAPAVALSSAR